MRPAEGHLVEGVVVPLGEPPGGHPGEGALLGAVHHPVVEDNRQEAAGSSLVFDRNQDIDAAGVDPGVRLGDPLGVLGACTVRNPDSRADSPGNAGVVGGSFLLPLVEDHTVAGSFD